MQASGPAEIMGSARPRPSGVRVKSHWFKSERPKSVGEIAGALAFIVWRIAQQVLRNMRHADFEIDAGPKYFDFLAEWLIYLTQVADRIAFERLADQRIAFTTVLANRVGEILADNRSDLLGDDGATDRKSEFIDLFNLRLDDYADFDLDDFGRMRYLAQRLSQLVGSDDRIWVHEQVMEIEAPQAFDLVHGAIGGLLDESPRQARRSGTVSGE